MRILRNVYNTLKYTFHEKPKPLGRWGLNHEQNHLNEIKGILANIDSCADKACGDPYTTKAAIDYINWDRKIQNKIDN